MADKPLFTLAKETVVDQRTGEVILRDDQLIETNEFRDVYMPALVNAGYTAVNWWEYDFMVPSFMLNLYLNTEHDRAVAVIASLEKQIHNAAKTHFYTALEVLANQLATAAKQARKYDNLLLQIEIENNKYILGI
jgi:hypothetical protein